MFNKKLTTIPQIRNQTSRNDAIEWEIPQKVSVAFMLIEKFGYTFSAKIRVEKKHWWSRSWKTFITHAPATVEAIRKGLEFLESFGYAIEVDTDQLEERFSDPDHS